MATSRSRDVRQSLQTWKALSLVMLGLLGRSEGFVSLPRRTVAVLAASMVPLPAAGDEPLRVTRPETGLALYSYDLPALGFEERNRAANARDPGLLGLAAEFASKQGVRITSGEAPQDFVKRRRLTVPRSRQKVLKYSLGEEEDLMEALVKETQEDDSEVLKHCWWRVLRKSSGGKSVIMQITMPEELTADLRQPMEVIWGGQGTLMRTNEEDFMRRWTPVVRQLAGPNRKRPQGAASRCSCKKLAPLPAPCKGWVAATKPECGPAIFCAPSRKKTKAGVPWKNLHLGTG
ncbi:unnamed protein product [Symbiodinium natans]|uniref:Uncharacterized protein n=1 Tax=Symbiodinium natans TaxID=878477 RepID=A0A812IK45_9DINO|nr:unnamed protein product [Symbiodinium natans]